MTPLSSFENEVQKYLVNLAPPAVVLAEVRNAAVEFFGETCIWRHEMDPVALSAGVSQVTLSYPDDTWPVQVYQVYLKQTANELGRPLDARTPEELQRRYADWKRAEGTPRDYTHPKEPLYIELVPTPYDGMPDSEVFIDVVVRPSRDATEVPEWMYERYVEVIAAGARSRLCSMPGRPWTNLDRARLDHDLFQQGKNHAISDRVRSFARNARHMEPTYPLA